MQLENLQVIMGQALFEECEGLEDLLQDLDEPHVYTCFEYGIIYKRELLDTIWKNLDQESKYENAILEDLKKVLAPFNDYAMIALQP